MAEQKEDGPATPTPTLQGAQMHSRQELMRLQEENPDHIEVYDVEYDKVDRVVPMSEVRELCIEARDSAKTLRSENPEWDDTQVRDAVVARSAAMRLFATKTHPQYFARMTSRETPDTVIRNMFLMIDVRARIDSGELDEDMALAAMQDRLLRECTKKAV